jgi:hypothetical protein
MDWDFILEGTYGYTKKKNPSLCLKKAKDGLLR